MSFLTFSPFDSTTSPTFITGFLSSVFTASATVFVSLVSVSLNFGIFSSSI